MIPRSIDWRLLLVRAMPGFVLALACAVFSPGLGSGFIFDDYPNIVENRLLQVSDGSVASWRAAAFSSPATDLQRPLAMLSFAANINLAGLDPWWMKLTNLWLHLVNALLLLGLARTVIGLSGATGRRAEAAALFAMSAWVLNPINFTPVLLIVQRMEVLSHTFVFASLWMYASARQAQLRGQRGWARILGSIFLLAPAGVLAKESAALVPVYALLLELTILQFRGHAGHRDRRLLAMYCVLVIPSIMAAVWVYPRVFGADAYATRQFNLPERLMTESRVLLDYLQWTVMPRLDMLALHHDDYVVSRSLLDPPSTILALFMLAALASSMLWLRTRRPLAALGIGWFLAGHVLTATVLPLELVFEHRNYFPSLGVCLVLADGLLLLCERPRLRVPAMAGAMALLCFYAGTTLARALEWSNPVRLASSEARKNPNSARAAYDWARTLVIMSNYDPKSPVTQQAISAIDRASLLPGSGILPEHAGLMLCSRAGLAPDPRWWLRLYDKLRTRPIGPQERGAMASMTRCQIDGKCRFPPEAMMEMFAAALERPDPEVMNIYGDYALNILGDTELALRLWSEAIALDPGQPQYRVNIARLNIALGQDEEARREIAVLRSLGHMGQNEARAAALEREMSNRGRAK